MIIWSRYSGYEVSSLGDKRFSAFHARLKDGRSIEEHYQCDIKGYDLSGTNWRLGKGKPPLDKSISKKQLFDSYKALWKECSNDHQNLLDELYQVIGPNGILRDSFATTEINQANVLAQILNEKFGLIEDLQRFFNGKD